MDLLKGKHILVTAGATGIGKATVLAAVREGAAVVATSRAKPTDERAVKLLEEAKKLGPGPVTFMQYDVTKFDEVEGIFKKAYDFMGGLDTLVYSAANNIMKPAEEQTVDDFIETYKVHLVGLHIANLAALKYMKLAGGGSIINLSSAAGITGTANQTSYGSAKGAVYAYTRATAKEWGKFGVRVNAVAPFVRTELMDEWFLKMGKEQFDIYKAQWAQILPLGGWPAEAGAAGDAIAFLASDLSRFITGQILSVDGGVCMVR